MAMQERVSIHKLFLPAGLLLLAFGLWGILNYFRLKGPGEDQLHELPLQAVTRVVPEPEIPGSRHIDNLWLRTSNDVTIRYRSRFPYSEEVRRLDTNYSLLLDRSNTVWAVKTGDGRVHARGYFEDYNIEARAVGKFCGSFLAAFAVLLLFGYFQVERGWPKAPPHERAKLEVYSRRLRLGLSLVGYLYLYGFAIAPWLMKFLPRSVVSLLWLVSAGLLLVLLSRKPPPAS